MALLFDAGDPQSGLATHRDVVVRGEAVQTAQRTCRVRCGSGPHPRVRVFAEPLQSAWPDIGIRCCCRAVFDPARSVRPAHRGVASRPWVSDRFALNGPVVIAAMLERCWRGSRTARRQQCGTVEASTSGCGARGGQLRLGLWSRMRRGVCGEVVACSDSYADCVVSVTG